MTRKTLLLGLMLILAGAAFAATGGSTEVKGYLLDNACTARFKGDAEKAKGHTVKCALMPPCAASGYSVMTEEGKLFKLDEEGNKKAKELLGNTKTEKGLTVKVEGTVEGEMIKVTSISEAM